jgi:hypothetical protein
MASLQCHSLLPMVPHKGPHSPPSSSPSILHHSFIPFSLAGQTSPFICMLTMVPSSHLAQLSKLQPTQLPRDLKMLQSGFIGMASESTQIKQSLSHSPTPTGLNTYMALRSYTLAFAPQLGNSVLLPLPSYSTLGSISTNA